MHKTRRELKNRRATSTCWLQGWFKLAGSKSKSSVWQLFCFIQAFAPVLFLNASLTGAAEALQAVTCLVQHWYHPLRATKGNYRLVHHAANPLQPVQGLTGTQLGLGYSSPKRHFPLAALSLWLSHCTRVLCPRQGYHLRSLWDQQSPGGKAARQAEMGGQALFCQPR